VPFNELTVSTWIKTSSESNINQWVTKAALAKLSLALC